MQLFGTKRQKRDTLKILPRDGTGRDSPNLGQDAGQNETEQKRTLTGKRCSKTEKDVLKQEKDVLKQENDVLKQENDVLKEEIWSFFF